jgi:hypothetical protein
MVSLFNRICRGIEDAWTSGFIQLFIVAVLAYVAANNIVNARDDARMAVRAQQELNREQSAESSANVDKQIVIGPDGKHYAFSASISPERIEKYFVKKGWQLRNGKWFSAAGEAVQDIKTLPSTSTSSSLSTTPIYETEASQFHLGAALWDQALPIVFMMLIIAYEVRRKIRLRSRESTP